MTRPHLLVVLADQLRASSIGLLGEDPVSTPALDRLAREGRVSTHSVSPYPVCSPARAMLLTGTYPWANGVPFNVNSATAPQGVGLRRDAVCWSDVLAEAGYRLGWIGKWHLTAPTEQDERWGEGRREDGKVWDAWTSPRERHGFDFWHSHGCCDDHFAPHYWTSDAPREEPVRVRQWSAEHETDVAIDVIEAAAAVPEEDRDPFALVLSLNPPHQPFEQVPEEYLEPYAGLDPSVLLPRPNVDLDSPTGREAAAIARRYFAAVTGVDAQVGRLLDTLDRTGLARDTIVLVTSDHGMQLGSHDLIYKNVPFEESMRVPFVVRWPEQIAPGIDDLLIGSVDVAPTLLGLTGLAGRIPAGTQGTDCSGALLGDPGAPRPDSALYFGPARAHGDPDVRGVRTHTHKLVVSVKAEGEPDVVLRDLVADPYELVDASVAQPATTRELLGLLGSRLSEIDDPWPGRALLPELQESA